MERSYNLRIYPNKFQRELINKTFGCSRFVYNYFLDRRKKVYDEKKETLGFVQCCRELTLLKQQYEWLREPDKCALQNSLRDLEATFNKFFKEKTGFPKFKSKKNRHRTYRTSFNNNNIEFLGNKIKLPKLGHVKCKGYQAIEGRILNATIIQMPSGKYYVSICVTDIEPKPLPLTNKSIGIDLGLRDFIITSDGYRYENPKFLYKSLEKLKKLQREFSRKQIGSSN